MSNKNKNTTAQPSSKNDAVINSETVNVTGTGSKVEVEVTDATTELGRPIDLKSQRQMKLLERALKTLSGHEVRKGRPVDMGSARQERLSELNEKREAGELKQGRPKYTEAQKAAAKVIKAQKAEQEKLAIQEMAKQMLAEQNKDTAAMVEA